MLWDLINIKNVEKTFGSMGGDNLIGLKLMKKINDNCIYKCNEGIKCKCTNCSVCEHNPKKEKPKLKKYYASGKSLIDGEWQSCGWTIEANSFAEAAKIAEDDKTFKIHSLTSYNVGGV